jgi:hypothetical protein
MIISIHRKDTTTKRKKGKSMTEENSKNTGLTDLSDLYKDTLCYTYEVVMLVQIIAPSKEIADEKLDRDGGYVSKRDVVYKHSTLIYKDGIQDEKQEESTI